MISADFFRACLLLFRPTDHNHERLSLIISCIKMQAA